MKLSRFVVLGSRRTVCCRAGEESPSPLCCNSKDSRNRPEAGQGAKQPVPTKGGARTAACPIGLAALDLTGSRGLAGSGRMRIRAFIVILLAVFAAPLRAEESNPLPVEEVAPGVYVHHGVHEEATVANQGGITNIGFVIGDAAVAVIDSGGSPMEGRALLAAIRRKTNLPIRYVINTHFHPDHVMGNAAFVAEHAEFIGHKNLPTGLLSRSDSYVAGYETVFGPGSAKDALVVPSHLVSGDETI